MNFEGSGNLLDVLMEGANYGDDGFIAEIHKIRKLWMPFTNPIAD
jgi:hypothetical protein